MVMEGGRVVVFAIDHLHCFFEYGYITTNIYKRRTITFGLHRHPHFDSLIQSTNLLSSPMFRPLAVFSERRQRVVIKLRILEEEVVRIVSSYSEQRGISKEEGRC